MFISFTAKKAQRECLSILYSHPQHILDIYSIAVPLVVKIDDCDADMAIN